MHGDLGALTVVSSEGGTERGWRGSAALAGKRADQSLRPVRSR
jgi:hypothetical protein